MASDSINCRCSQSFKAKGMAILVLFVCTLLCAVQQSLALRESPIAVPDYRKLHENLSLMKDIDRVNSKNTPRGDAPIIADIGRVFKFSLDGYILKGDGKNIPLVKLFEHGKGELPLWLSYSEKKNRLIGVPTMRDKGRIKIILKTAHNGQKRKYKFEIDVREGKDRFHCHHGDPAFVAAALLNTDIRHFSGLARRKLLRKFSDYIDVAVHDFTVEERKSGSIFDVSMETAGPGDGIVTKAPGIVVKWKIDCKLGLAGDISVNSLKASSGNKRIFDAVGVPFLGWYVYRHQSRVRRQIFPGITPVATPAATPTATAAVPGKVTTVISGTPVISSTPTLVIRRTSTVRVVSSSSIPAVVKPTPVVTAKPPTTGPRITTEQPVTTEPLKTTKEPSTAEQSTKRVTGQVTTKSKTASPKPGPTTKQGTMKPQVTTKMVPSVSTKAKDMPPVLKNSIDLIKAKVGQPIKVKIERDVFEDDIDGDTYRLTLALKRNTAQKLVDAEKSLIFLDTQSFYLYMLPMLANVGDHSFALQATDSSGNQRNAIFTVKVADENIQYNDIFNVTVDLKFDAFIKSARNKVWLAEKVAKATDVDYRSMRLQNFYRGSVVMSYANTELHDGGCNSVKAEAYKAKLDGPEFQQKMAPEYDVLKTSSAKVGANCRDGVPNWRPTKEARSTYKWWEVVLIPVIVIAVLLLVIGLIFFFLYRRKRRFEPHKEDKNTFLYQKKPVIFREEYEEKPDVLSLEPMILPNEKLPSTNSAYQPRSSTPDGNGSSSASTEAEDNSLIDKTAPQTPPPRSPQYRSPPPYSEP